MPLPLSMLGCGLGWTWASRVHAVTVAVDLYLQLLRWTYINSFHLVCHRLWLLPFF